ncbi:MAG: DUF2065 domain-containing protein [Xanthomonadaceae bacterium]|nr:DUF2065 domain-containing protein [Xanthomonadaceae bacterium]
MTVYWSDLGAAIALLLVLEGLLPFLSPDRLRRTLLQIINVDDRTLRTIGLVSILAGLGLLALVR